ncbi:malate dehydrogenase (quinone), partial [Priestia megaterium]
MSNVQKKTDVILIGAGVMSATLGSLLKELAPEWDIKVFEKLADAGEESSNEWNNAGTGHSALCELNYTSEKANGSIDITKAIRINEQFQLSRQFWSYLVSSKLIRNPQDFIMPIPHMSLVQGEKNVSFLKKRFEALSNNPLFQGMEYSDSPEKLKEWIPLIMKGRTSKEPIAATKIDSGTDVNFGALTRMLFDHLKNKGVNVHYKRSVKDIKRKDGMWEVKVADVDSGKVEYHTAKFIFIGGGGGSLPLLQKTGIPESKHIGGFPVSGLFMVCNNPEVIAQHHGKVYGKAKVGAPPMSVPHLDTRYIDNKKTLLFGPFAGFSPKFLKTGSNLDLISSVKPNNILTMLAAGVKEMALTKYLIQQVLLSNEKRVEELREFIPNAKSEDWDIVVAGQRVQVIKDTEAGGKGTLQFGTEVVSAADGSVAALLGASPGASTAVHVMLEVLEKCF